MNYGSKAIIVAVRCVCGWRGELPMRTDCPSCGRDWTCRVTSGRLAVLRRIAAWMTGGDPVTIEPAMRMWMTDSRHRVITTSDPPVAPTLTKYIRKPKRVWVLTELGQMAIAEPAPQAVAS